MMLRLAPIIVFCLCGSLIVADDTETAARQERLAAMRRRAEALQLKIGEQPDRHRVGKEPLFRYSDAARTTTDGTLWLWTQNECPVAATCLFNDSRDGFQWNYELVSLKESPLVVDGRTGWNWRPDKLQRRWISFAEPIPAQAGPARLGQMKALVSQFRAEEDLDGDVTQLRLLPSPVYRYRSPADKIEDGALFLFVFGTNPEVIAQIETLTDRNRTWRVGFARLTAARISVFREKEKVWEADRVREWNPRHDYFSHYGPDFTEGQD